MVGADVLTLATVPDSRGEDFDAVPNPKSFVALPGTYPDHWKEASLFCFVDSRGEDESYLWFKVHESSSYFP